MNERPPHEPSRRFARPNRLWDDQTRHTPSLGCASCLDFGLCGGVHTDAGILDCNDLCSCRDKNRCDMVCRFNPRLFVARMHEVAGPSFDNAPRVRPCGVPDLPHIIPFVDHRYGRSSTLNEAVVALSLYEVVNMATGRLHASSRQALADRFLIPTDATVLLSGVDKDGPIERWWELPNRAQILAELARLGVAMITAPNYSVLTDVPRMDNFHAMKRILLAWTEMAVAGIPAALHINARTERDYRRWAELIAKRNEIQILAFEFATGAGRADRIDWHIEQLCKLADHVDRSLCLVIRGGGRKAAVLRRHFAHVVLIETESFARAIRRRRAVLTNTGRLKWVSSPTLKGAPIDDLVAHNVEMVRRAHQFRRESIPQLRSIAAQRAPNRNDKPIDPGLLGYIVVPAETGRVAPEPQRMISTAKT